MNAPAARTARIFLIDDHPVVRQGLRLLFSQESHIVCGEAGNGRETLERIDSSGAEVAVLDLSLDNESGLDLIDALRAAGVAVLIYSMHEDAETIERAFAAGAGGYVSKRENEDILLDAVSDLLTGHRHVSQRAAQSLLNKALSGVDAGQMLSGRENAILSLLGRGMSNSDIAAALSIGVRTVETYFTRLIGKLGLDGMKALRQYAIRNSFGNPPEQ